MHVSMLTNRVEFLFSHGPWAAEKNGQRARRASHRSTKMEMHGQAADRLSALPDETLELILSQLGSDEAVRTSALSRRWRDVYAAVPVVDIRGVERIGRDSPTSEIPVCFEQRVTGAILCKGPGTPIHAFRLNTCLPPSGLLDQWMVTAASSGAEEIDIMLRYLYSSRRRLCPFDSSENASADFDGYDRKRYTKTQRQLFGCTTLRCLRLTNWTLDLPPCMAMSSLETLYLARIMDPGRQLQQLLLSCPRLADLTLQECPSIRKIAVTSVHLRSFAMICCHHATRIRLSSPCLQSLHYKGGLPRRPLFKVANFPGVVVLRIEICEDLSGKQRTDVAPVSTLIARCTNLTHLYLSLRPSMACHSSLFRDAIRGLPLRLLGLGFQGYLLQHYDVSSVADLLCVTENLEVLSLFALGPPPEVRSYPYFSRAEPVADTDVDHSSLVTDLGQRNIRCLDHKLRKISIANYRGLQLEKILAKFLLSRAAALEEFSVALTAGLCPCRHARELRSWRSNHHTIVAVH